MKLTNKPSTATIKSVPFGQCFMDDEDYFIKVNGVMYGYLKHLDNYAVNLTTGVLHEFIPNYEVRLVEIEGVIK